MLKISKNVGLTDLVSAGNPITTTHPTTGTSVEQKLYLFNDAAANRYEAITIDPTDTVTTDESGYIQLAPDNVGAAGTYLAPSAALSMANISDSNVPKPFWVKVTTPSLTDAVNKTDVKLKVDYNEFAV